MLAVATVLTGWAAIDAAGDATQTGEVPYTEVVWMATAYLAGLLALSALRS